MEGAKPYNSRIAFFVLVNGTLVCFFFIVPGDQDKLILFLPIYLFWQWRPLGMGSEGVEVTHLLFANDILIFCDAS